MIKIDENEEIIQKLSSLDTYGKKAVLSILEIELERVTKTDKCNVISFKPQTKIIDYFELVSAGKGVFLESCDKDLIEIPLNSVTEKADFAIKIRGNSMEPDYYDSDIVLVESQPAIELDDLGIFILNNEGYFKKYKGDRLESLNPIYRDIEFGEFDYVLCKGKVIGKL